MYYANIDKNNFLIGWFNDEVHSEEMIHDKAMSVTDDVWLDAVSINANFYDKKTSRFIRKEKPKTKEQVIAEAEQKKQLCSEEAEKNITILERKVRLNMATDNDKNSLTEWEIYSIKVDGIDTSTAPDIDWPQKP